MNTRKMYKILSILSFVLACAVPYIVLTRIFVVRQIIVVGNSIGLEIDRDKVTDSMLLFPGESYRNMLLARYGQLEDVSIRKIFPDTIEISIRLRKPVAALVQSDAVTLIDKNGYIVGFSRQSDLPQIRYASGSQVFQTHTDPVLRYVLDFIGKFPQTEYKYFIQIESENRIYVSIDDIRVVMSRDRDPGQTASTLQTILRGVRMKGNAPKQIDLRFSKPVLSY